MFKSKNQKRLFLSLKFLLFLFSLLFFHFSRKMLLNLKFELPLSFEALLMSVK